MHLGVAGVALAGVLAGHAVTYLLLTLGSPAALLASTGHGYLDAAARVGLAAAILGVLALFADRLRTVLGGGAAGIPVDAHGLYLRLASVQVGLFVFQEIGERWASGAPVPGVLDHGLLGIGVVLQLILAALGARFLRWVLRAADRIGRTLRADRLSAGERSRRPARPIERPAGAGQGRLTAWSLRGPPRAPRAYAPAR
jgi:hypothetical protein